METRTVDSQLKQRLIGAAVLVALAVIFLPMLVKGPAPDSGVSDVSLKVPDAPQGEYETRDLPLVVPDRAPGGVTGMQPAADAGGQALPTVDTAAAPFAAYGRRADADTVVSRLRAARLPAYREPAAVDGKETWRVRIGPYGTRADAEIARLQAQRAGRYQGARVIALDAAEPATQ